MAEIQSVESEAAAFFDQISRYFISRAKIVSKVAKYPHIEDYRRAVQVYIHSIHMSYRNSINIQLILKIVFSFILFSKGIRRKGISQFVAGYV